jgi:hypothetical protein
MKPKTTLVFTSNATLYNKFDIIELRGIDHLIIDIYQTDCYDQLTIVEFKNKIHKIWLTIKYFLWNV